MKTWIGKFSTPDNFWLKFEGFDWHHYCFSETGFYFDGVKQEYIDNVKGGSK
jgi:hypothetical protein